MVGHKLLKLGDECCPAPAVELCLDTRLQRAQALFLQVPGPIASERLVEHVSQGRAAPQREGISQYPRSPSAVASGGRFASARDEQLEPVGIEFPSLDREQVPAPVPGQPAVADELAQPVDVGVEGVAGAGGRRLPPQRIDQPVPGGDLVRVQEQERE